MVKLLQLVAVFGWFDGIAHKTLHILQIAGRQTHVWKLAF